MKADFIVIGSGIAGLNFALNASNYGNVTILTKKNIVDSNTNYAQGGIAAVLEKTDSYENHINDTLIAGSFHNNKKAVEIMVKEGPSLIFELLERGVRFNKSEGKISLTKEGGHSQRRIAFFGDQTGAEIERGLIEAVSKNKKIKVLTHTFVVDLIRHGKEIIGVTYFDEYKPVLKNIFSKAVIIASGGAGQIYYPHTTNPEISTGDGVAMALNVGCEVKDMEFIQFHPTALFKKGLPTFLLSESLRGEGAFLVNGYGERFMLKYDDRGELAPRDIVARAIYEEEKSSPIFLDMRHFTKDKFENHFKKIFSTLQEFDLNPLQEIIPISPSAHYMIGGVKVDLYGFTGINRLYAFGEVACTGVHGANRLGSNSLLEALVFSKRIISLLPDLIRNEIVVIKETKNKQIMEVCDIDNIRKIRDSLTIKMWKYVGIMRKMSELDFALKEVLRLQKELHNYECISPLYFETRNMIIVSLEVIKSAIKRKKSLGAHYIEK